MLEQDRFPRWTQATTIEELQRLGDGLALRCIQCAHIAPVDLLFMAGRLGEDAAVMDLVARGRCTKCGSREVTATAQEQRQ